MDPLRRDVLFAVLVLRKGRLSAHALADCLEAFGRGRDPSLTGSISAAAGIDAELEAALLEEAGALCREEGDELLDGLEEESKEGDLGLSLPEDGDAGLDLAGFDLDAGAVPSKAPSTPEADRYIPGKELGHGGLGRVVAAVDRILGREVAVKEMLRGSEDAGLLERFLREGRVAGRLMHPNIVPVYDVGVREEEGRRTPYFVMGRIEGHDLGQILHGGKSQDLSRQRLLAIFQDVCLAIAYAHDHGVIHRDLKPANVMVGHYGEVYVVDWGLAKVMGEAEPGAGTPRRKDSTGESAPDSGSAGSGENEDRNPSDAADRRPSEHDAPDRISSGHSAITLDGDVLGTPNYMPPEQARGQVEAVDQRSDIYSLGAILYEILTYHPPYEGPNKLSVLAQVMKGALKTPSTRVTEVYTAKTLLPGACPPESAPSREALFREESAEAGAAPVAGAREEELPDPVPPELEEIVLKAMAREKGDRHASVREIHDAVQRYLEGEKERERNRLNAARKIAEGKALLESSKTSRASLYEASAQVTKERERVQSFWPVDQKRDLWALEERVRSLREEVIRNFTRASTTLQAAFEFEPGNPEAREALAAMFWDQFQREEEAGDGVEMVRYENLVREYDDGQHAALLQGDGTLAIESRAYPCPCLTEGRTVLPEELEKTAFHPFSGRCLADRPASQGLPALEPQGPVRLRIHAAGCAPVPLEGADVWIFSYRETDRLMLPVCPEGFRWKGFRRSRVPDRILDRCFEPDSPFRPGEGIHLGRTPVKRFPIPMGAYLVVADREGRRPVRASLRIGRARDESLRVTFFKEEEFPPGYAQIPGGPFVFQGDREVPTTQGRFLVDLGDFFLRIHPVTCAEYLSFLDALASRDGAEALRRAPRRSEGMPYWPRGPDGRFVIPTREWLRDATPDDRDRAQRLQHATADWEAEWPVQGISWEDATAYAAWERERIPFLFRLPHQVEWEKAARGADGWIYPWGNGFDESYCNNSRTFKDGIRPVSVRLFPTDESPFGVRGMCGNASDPGMDDIGTSMAGWRFILGGSWGSTGAGLHLSYRLAAVPSAVYPPRVGIRLGVPVRLGEPAPMDVPRV
jgi:serine/threonine protein kinase/formylglycine-generating enzyme required for sulfatase activity